MMSGEFSLVSASVVYFNFDAKLGQSWLNLLSHEQAQQVAIMKYVYPSVYKDFRWILPLC